METTQEGDLFDKCFNQEGLFLDIRNSENNYFAQPLLEGPIGTQMKFNNKMMTVWSINDYLGLAGHPAPKMVAREVLEEYGTSYPMGARLMSGFTRSHEALEKKLAEYCQKPSALLFNYGYLGILGIITSLVGKNDTVVIDHDAHACIVDGAKLASNKRSQFRIFRHNNMEHLERILKATRSKSKGGILIVTDGVYGMSGELAPLPELIALKEKYNARLLVDDAHGIGIMGESGRGVGEHFKVQDKIDLYFSTFAKCFAGIGGFVAGDTAVIEHIKWNARPVIFAKNLPLIYTESVSATLDIILAEPERREKLWEIANLLQKRLREEGFDIGSTGSPITPVYMQTEGLEKTKEFIRTLREKYRVFCSGVMYPVVPPGVLLLRLVPSCNHTREDVENTVQALVNTRNEVLKS